MFQLCVYAACVIFFLFASSSSSFSSFFSFVSFFLVFVNILCYLLQQQHYRNRAHTKVNKKAHTEIYRPKRSTNKTADLFGLFLLHTTAYTTYSCSNHNFYYGPETWTNGFHVELFADFPSVEKKKKKTMQFWFSSWVIFFVVVSVCFTSRILRFYCIWSRLIWTRIHLLDGIDLDYFDTSNYIRKRQQQWRHQTTNALQLTKCTWKWCLFILLLSRFDFTLNRLNICHFWF